MNGSSRMTQSARAVFDETDVLPIIGLKPGVIRSSYQDKANTVTNDATNDVRHQIVDLLPRLRRFAYALTGEKDRGDDLVQETCMRALSRLEQWEHGTRLDSWMYRIAQNIWFDNIRALKVRGEVIDIDTAHDLAGDDGRKVTENRLTLNEVSAAVSKLPPDQRIVIVLVCVDGLSYKQASEILEIPMGTVMSRLARARQAIYVATHAEVPIVAVELEARRGQAVR
jgi:RNA polymerase sigma-70 factor, ECF subfamily